MTGLFASTLFLSASLVFFVQPMVGKLMLPLFGGAPAVWQTSLVFFQAMLLAGYGYAHLSQKLMPPAARLIVHFGLLGAAMLFLPIALPATPAASDMTTDHQVWHLLRTLFTVAGLPFFILSSTSPLLQAWFASTGHHTAKDPYYLSVASNLGSFAALFAFPALVEPFATLRQASSGWAVGYGVLIVLIGVCAWRSRQWSRTSSVSSPVGNEPPAETVKVSWKTRGTWLAYAAVPSSLLLGVTSFITTEVASIPFLGILPLGIYLATFVLAFARRRWISIALLQRLLPFAVLILGYQLYTESTHPIFLIVGFHLCFFFGATLLCHSRLADLRPAASELTSFYLWMSFGGVIGGLFNALVAPHLFTGIHEYPLAILLAAGLGGMAKQNPDLKPWLGRRGDLIVPAGIFIVMAMAAWQAQRSEWLEPLPRRVLLFSLGAVLAFFFKERSWRFALCMAAALASQAFLGSLHGKLIYAERNFFGVSRVTIDPGGKSHRMVHGNTIHGRQFLDDLKRCEPLTYFHRTGPLGRIFTIFRGKPGKARIGVTGLGCGAIAGFALPGDRWDYYEIDPAVIRMANDPKLFTFLTGCARGLVTVIPGDARLRLQEAATEGYDLLIMDAFASDTIPLHLLTREAMRLYLDKLAPEGLLAVNISNRYLEL
ncbi:MAG: hypothetical protein FJ405_14710, partial [Verrucomicrobia bacterium]|nr:hypothetical protein [Verrucomicrobiota bacterium]